MKAIHTAAVVPAIALSRYRQARHVGDHVKIASRILTTVADGVTDAGKLPSVAIEEGLCAAN